MAAGSPADSIDRAPLNPPLAEHRFFYGWVVVACAFTILCIAYGIQFTFGMFMPFISTDTGWDRGSLSLPSSEACRFVGRRVQAPDFRSSFRPQRVPNALPIWPRQSDVCRGRPELPS